MGYERDLRIDWIKGWSIIAVLVNHLHTMTYEGGIVLYTSFAVPIMILLAGYTSGISVHKDCSYKKVLKRCCKVWSPYIISTIVFVLWHYKRIDMFVLSNYIVTFTTSGAYFVCVFTELIMISVLLYRIYEKGDSRNGLIILVICGVVAKLLNTYTTVGPFLSGASRVLGGTYLFIFSAGMWMFFNKKKISKKIAYGGGYYL